MTDLALAEEIFKKAEEKEGIGLELLEEGDSFLGLGLSYEEENRYTYRLFSASGIFDKGLSHGEGGPSLRTWQTGCFSGY